MSKGEDRSDATMAFSRRYTHEPCSTTVLYLHIKFDLKLKKQVILNDFLIKYYLLDSFLSTYLQLYHYTTKDTD